MAETWLTRLQALEVEILKDVDAFCRKEGIRYCIIAGTLLGAVRHGGFIPWDDDTDIVMPREDFERFKKLAPGNMGEKYFISTQDNEQGNPKDMIKVRRQGTVYETRWSMRFPKPCTGIWLDIFPLDEVRRETGRVQRAVGNFVQGPMQRLLNSYSQPIEKGSKKALARRLIRLLPFSFYRGIRDGLMQCGNGKGYAYYVNYFSQYGHRKQTMPKDWYFPAHDIVFDGVTVLAPHETEKILTRIYGANYMQIPPEEKRVVRKPVRISFNVEGPDEVL